VARLGWIQFQPQLRRCPLWHAVHWGGRRDWRDRGTRLDPASLRSDRRRLSWPERPLLVPDSHRGNRHRHGVLVARVADVLITWRLDAMTAHTREEYS